VKDVDLREGPGTKYKTVAKLPAAFKINIVHGLTQPSPTSWAREQMALRTDEDAFLPIRIPRSHLIKRNPNMVILSVAVRIEEANKERPRLTRVLS
jgi:hypothetical protein